MRSDGNGLNLLHYFLELVKFSCELCRVQFPLENEVFPPIQMYVTLLSHYGIVARQVLDGR